MLAMAIMAVLTVTAPQTASAPVLRYEEIVRCAGLTQAASELEGGESGEGRSLYDAALYWSLTAIQAADARGQAPAAGEAEQTRARIRAVRELSARNAEAQTELRRCRSRAPRLG
jgi:hypothetical protein